VSGEKRKTRSQPTRRIIAHLCSERNYGRFNRIIPLQRWVISVHEATAELRNGVLTVHLPKLKDRRGAEFRVPVKEEDK
jgi:HSP20 family molecular chaperone IbpA